MVVEPGDLYAIRGAVRQVAEKDPVRCHSDTLRPRGRVPHPEVAGREVQRIEGGEVVRVAGRDVAHPSSEATSHVWVIADWIALTIRAHQERIALALGRAEYPGVRSVEPINGHAAFIPGVIGVGAQRGMSSASGVKVR